MHNTLLLVVAQVLGQRDTRIAERHYSHLSPSFISDIIEATAMDLGPHGENVTPLRPAAS